MHDDEERALSDVKVKAAWSQKGDGTRSCTTGSEGVCELRLEGLRKNEERVTLRVTDLVHASRVYTAQFDHGGDSESGSEIPVSKP